MLDSELLVPLYSYILLTILLALNKYKQNSFISTPLYEILTTHSWEKGNLLRNIMLLLVLPKWKQKTFCEVFVRIIYFE